MLRWERDWHAPARPFLDPATYPVVSVAMSGTHDNEPLAVWWEELTEDDRAAILRLPNLATRGTWDGDQGHDMLVVRALLRDGVVPLLGPPTSIGSVHHGAWYYLLLSPAAALTGGDDPVAIVALIALLVWLGMAARKRSREKALDD